MEVTPRCPGPWDSGSPRPLEGYDPLEHGARCDLCPLQGNAFVPPEPPRDGREKPRLIIVGEGPGRKEEVYRTPFIGQSGAILDDTLSEVGVARREIYATNAALCRGDTDEENDVAAECCAPRLGRELAAMPADVPIVPLGKSAARSLLGVKSILVARGFVWTARPVDGPLKAARALRRKALRRKDEASAAAAELRIQGLEERHKLAGRIIMPSVHPAFVARSDCWTPVFRIDLDRAARVADGRLTLKGLADRIERVYRVRDLRPRTYIVAEDVRTIERASRRLGPVVSCDIETERRTPLSPLLVKVLCVGVSDGERTLVIGPWRQEIHAAALTALLSAKTVVKHNGYNFDDPCLEKDGVVIDPTREEDTLIAHHTFASHMPQRLDHVVSVFLDASPWKIRHGMRGGEEKGLAPTDLDADELYFYNACDCVLTKQAWDAIQDDLRPELSVYAGDKVNALLCKGMQVDGFHVNVARKRLLSKMMRRREAGLKGVLRRIARMPALSPRRHADVRRALFVRLKAPMLNPTKTGLPSTSNATLEEIKKGRGRAARFARALLELRVVDKSRGTYVDAVQVHTDRRAHFNWKSFGAGTGRYSGRMQSCPRWSLTLAERVREMYTASKGNVLVYFDLSQAEARFAAHLSGDENFIASCRGDVHANNALVVFSASPKAVEALERDPKGKSCARHADTTGKNWRAPCNCGKDYRDIAKNVGFAIAYLAEAPAVFAYLQAHGFDVDLTLVEGMLGNLKRTYATYYAYVGENVAYVQTHGYLRTALTGRLRRFGYSPKPTEVANFPIQSGIADVMNIRLPTIRDRVRTLGGRLVGQYHDAAVFDVPKPAAPEVRSIIESTWKEPVRLETSIVCRSPREFVLPAEIKEGHALSEF
jgi:uracil-DNA glycosylase family 4